MSRPQCPDVGLTQSPTNEEHATTRLDLHREELADAIVLHVRGEVDASNVELLERALRQVCVGDGVRILVDATAITFLASVGVAALVRAQARCQAHGLDFAVAAAGWAVLRPLQATGMDQLVKIFPSLEAARRAAPSPGGGDPQRPASPR